MSALPTVSMILTTRDRPNFIKIALACYAHQTYPNRELIVVDDGDEAPVDEADAASVGGRVIRVPTGTTLGEKLNHGIDAARGALVQKMDDDDWYAPDFVANTAGRLLADWQAACRPAIAYTAPFLFFHVAAWEIRRSVDNNLPGATICFPRAMWKEQPFRHVPGEEDLWFYRDHSRLGAVSLPVRGVQHFLAVRHAGAAQDRRHTWQRQWSNQSLEDYLLSRPLLPEGPEAFLPGWALAFYRALRDDILANEAAASGAPA